MTLHLLFLINAVAATLYAIALLLIPAQFLTLYGLTPDPSLIYLARLFGGTVLGYGAVAWGARNAEAGTARRAIVLGNFIAFAVSLVAALVGQLSGVVNGLGWSTVVLYIFFTAGYGYFQFVKPSATGS